MEAVAPAIGGTTSEQPELKLMKDLQLTAPKLPLFSGVFEALKITVQNIYCKSVCCESTIKK